MKKILTALLALVAFGGAQVLAETENPERDGKSGPKCEEIRQTRKENRAAKREHRRQQHQENKAFHESLAELDPENRVEAILQHRIQQHSENEAFHESRYNNMVAAVQSCEEIPEEHQENILEKLSDHYQEASEFHKSIHEEVVDFLGELSTSDLTPEEQREALKEFHEDIKEELRNWREEHRPDREGRRDKRGRQGPPQT